jgi:NADPH-dependent 2,4-dienoyl-CoA reductase/sulfur reductase-like enzyme
LDKIVIIGAGCAGVNTAMFLRQYGYTGMITLLGEEKIHPYQKPPLSKTFLTTPQTPAAAPIRPAAALHKAEVDLVLGTQVDRITRADQAVMTTDGQTYAYDRLVIATGSTPRKLPCDDGGFENLYALRSLAEAQSLRSGLAQAGSVCLIGAGVIGMEIASAAKTLGKSVTVIEAAGRILQRTTTPCASNFVMGRMRDKGVIFHLNTQVERFEGAGNTATACVLTTGQTIAADVFVVGIGAVPNMDLALAAEIACKDGILVDHAQRTSEPAIYAVGDCANAFNPFYDRRVRLETIDNAISQSKIAAASICEVAAPAQTPPRFWSDMNGMKLQGVGALARYDRIITKSRDNPTEIETHALRDDQVVAAETINLPRRQTALTELIGQPNPAKPTTE